MIRQSSDMYIRHIEYIYGLEEDRGGASGLEGNMTKKLSNFQLLKIIAMLMIISHHFVSKNAFNVDTEIIGITTNKLLLQILGNNAFIGNNLFFLVSAWFLCVKSDEETDLKYSIASCLRLEKTVLFYSINMYIITLIFKQFSGGGSSGLLLLLKSVFPISFGLWWYPTTYIVFLLIWPFYHKGLSSLSNSDLKKCIAVMLVLWSGSTLIPYTDFGANNLCAFLMLYAITIYIRREKISFNNCKKQFIRMIVFPYITAIMSIIVMDMLGTKIQTAATYSCYYLRGNFRPISMFVAIGLFMWATNWNIKYSKVINFVGDTTFGIYLFHMYPPVMEFLFSNLFRIEEVVNSSYAVLYLVAVTIIIFAVGVIVDTVRITIFNFVNILKVAIKMRD